jgi:hypothetical protein
MRVPDGVHRLGGDAGGPKQARELLLAQWLAVLPLNPGFLRICGQLGHQVGRLDRIRAEGQPNVGEEFDIDRDRVMALTRQETGGAACAGDGGSATEH